MKPVPAIVESDLAPHTSAIQAALKALREARSHEEQAERQFETARQVTARARLDLGRALIAARGRWPARGPKAKAWTEYLADQRVDADVALEAMAYAGYVEERFPGSGENAPGNLTLPTMREAGLDNRPRLGAPEPEDAAPVDRDTWCTPKWITDAIGDVDLDPCSNERSTVQAIYAYRLDQGEDGLKLVTSKWIDGASVRTFINPPYSDVGPWIQAFGHTRFVFLLKLDPSTRWFAELLERTELVLIPRGTRIQFEAPPGVPPDKAQANQFPHALFYAHEEDATAAIRALCFAWRVQHEPRAE